MKSLSRGPWILCILSMGCAEHASPARLRAERAAEAQGPIQIGVVFDHARNPDFGQGMETAAQVLGTDYPEFKLKVLDSRGELQAEKMQAQLLLEDLGVTAVLGHDGWTGASATAIQYEFHGLTFITPALGSAGLSRKGFIHGLRSHPSSEDFGAGLARLAHAKGLSRILVVHANDRDGLGVANAFEGLGDQLRVRVVHRIAYVPGTTTRLGHAVAESERVRRDAVLIAASGPAQKEVLSILKATGWTGPVLGLQAPSRDAATDGQELYYLRLSVNEAATPLSKKFSRAYRKEYGQAPSLPAALAFDELWLLLDAVVRAKSRVPKDVSRALRTKSKPRVGLTGRYEFSDTGARVQAPLQPMRYLDGHSTPLDDTQVKSPKP